MHQAEQHAKIEGDVAGNGNQHVVGQDADVQELEGAVLDGFDGCDVAGQGGELLAHFLTRLAV